jgi:hypothetical protein
LPGALEGSLQVAFGLHGFSAHSSVTGTHWPALLSM